MASRKILHSRYRTVFKRQRLLHTTAGEVSRICSCPSYLFVHAKSGLNWLKMPNSPFLSEGLQTCVVDFGKCVTRLEKSLDDKVSAEAEEGAAKIGSKRGSSLSGFQNQLFGTTAISAEAAR